MYKKFWISDVTKCLKRIFTSLLYLDLSNESTNLNSRLLMCLNVSYAQRQPILYRNSCTFCCYLCVNTSFSFSNHFSLPFCVCCTAESSFLCVLSMFKLPKFSVLKHRYLTLWIFTNEIKRKKQALMFYKILHFVYWESIFKFNFWLLTKPLNDITDLFLWIVKYNQLLCK